MMSRLMIKTFLLLIAFLAVKSEVVCSEDELVREILEDLEDNGIYSSLFFRKT